MGAQPQKEASPCHDSYGWTRPGTPRSRSGPSRTRSASMPRRPRFAARGANELRPGPGGDGRAERVALGLLGDLLDHRGCELHARTGLALERGRLGVWLLGEAGAVLVRPRRTDCYCVKASDPEL